MYMYRYTHLVVGRARGLRPNDNTDNNNSSHTLHIIIIIMIHIITCLTITYMLSLVVASPSSSTWRLGNLGCGRIGWILINGAAAKVMNFDRLGKQVRPGTFLGKIKVGRARGLRPINYQY